MLLSELATALKDFLNSKNTIWGDGETVARVELDPDKCLLKELGVYIIPDLSIYNVQSSGTKSRRPRVMVNKGQSCSLIVSKVFEQLRTGDGVANWDEAAPILDTREKAEEVLLTYGNTKITLIDVESAPIFEEELNNRNFVAMTTFTYEINKCLEL